jgi:hypothetical protein
VCAGTPVQYEQTVREEDALRWVVPAGPGRGGAHGRQLHGHLHPGAYTRPLFSSTYAILVTPPRVPLSNRLEETRAPNVSHKMCLR